MVVNDNLETEITKKWLTDNPYNPYDLPEGWEIKFGMRGKFMKYDSVEHAERKNTYNGMPFGGANHAWEELKSNLQDGDEIWLVGNDGLAIYLIRNNSVVNESCGKWQHTKRGFCVILWYS